MPVYAVFAIRNEDFKVSKEAYMLDKFGFFARMTLKSVLKALAIDFSKNLKSGTNEYLEIEEKLEEEKIFISTEKTKTNRVILITDGDYNATIRFKALKEALRPGRDYEELVKDYKDWKTKDITAQIEKEMREANENVVKGLAAVLDRGQTLNDLVEKSENLSSQTKKLFKTAKKQNACC